jgi:hypothetical protein
MSKKVKNYNKLKSLNTEKVKSQMFTTDYSSKFLDRLTMLNLSPLNDKKKSDQFQSPLPKSPMTHGRTSKNPNMLM